LVVVEAGHWTVAERSMQKGERKKLRRNVYIGSTKPLHFVVVARPGPHRLEMNYAVWATVFFKFLILLLGFPHIGL